MGLSFMFCMIFCLLLAGKVISDCPSTVYKDVQGFGTGCKYRCNCKNQLCNNMTGECQDGCLPGWMGPSCQYRNLANQILRSQQNPTAQIESEKASVATDGNVTTCSRTGSAVGQQTFWYAELREQTYIVGFVIKTIQEDTDRFQGFSINVGNNTNVTEICYRHGVNANGNTTMDINCEKPVVGSIFRIQLAESKNRPLVLCEVEIYGGRLVSFNKPTYIESTLDYRGTWNSFYAVDGRHPKLGEDQDNNTIRTCAGTETSIPARNKWWKVDLNNTYSIIAVSFYGRYSNPEQFERFIVKTGFNDSSSQLFFEDLPSSNVNEYIPKSKALTWPVDGAIAKVERNGGILLFCELELFADCKYGFCGWECNETCMCSSQTTGTHKILGTCPHGCSRRWTGLGNKCDIVCPDYKWGVYCNNTCGNCIEQCYATTGDCPGSCRPGWKLPKCSEECSDGTYGTNCLFTCGNCKNDAFCNKTTGDCEFGCQPGYKQHQCIDICDNGTFGDGCTIKCGNCLNGEPCHHVTGECPRGCAAGYQGLDCKSCKDDLYGENCTSSCGYCSNNEPCDKTSGYCRACAPGYQMNNCTENCTSGSFGEGCLHECHCKDGLPCDSVTGYCPNMDCNPGWKGDACNIDMSLTDSSAAAIAGGIIASLVVVASVTVVVVMWKIRKTCISCKNTDANKRVKAEKNEPEASYYNLESLSSGNSCPQQLEFSTAVPTYESLREADEQSRTQTYECLQNQTNNASVSSKLPDGKQNVEPVYVNSK